MTDQSPPGVSRVRPGRFPIAARHLLAAAMFVVSALSLLLILDRYAAVTVSLGCWYCVESLSVIAVVMLLAIAQQVLFAVSSVLMLPSISGSGTLRVATNIVLTSSLVNAVAPAKAGTVLRMFLFKDRLGISYETFVGSQSALSIVSLLVVSPAALILVLAGTADVLTMALMAVALVLIAWALRVLSRFGAQAQGGSPFMLRVRLGIEAMRRPLADLRIRLWLVTLSVLQFLVVAARAGLALLLVGQEYSPAAAIVTAVALVFAPLVAVLPGGAGTRELMFGFGAVLSGVSVEQAVAAALIDRALGTTALVLAAVPAGWRLSLAR